MGDETIHGALGRILRIDLSSGTIETDDIAANDLKAYLGGSGLAARLLYPHLCSDLDALAPAAPLVIMTGPLTGTRAPNCGRYTVCARSPLTGYWGESNIGGKFGPALKFAGYDGIFITGRAETPQYLVIEDDAVELRDASAYWGTGTYDTIEGLQREHRDTKLCVMCIGPAGEHLVRYAAIRNSGGRTAGRCGLGAVFGSKQLKAICVRGSGRVAIHDPDRFNELAKNAVGVLNENFNEQMFKSLGTAGYVDYAQALGDMPNRYFSSGYFDGADRISGAAMAESILVGRSACYRCPIGCGRVIEITEPPYELERTEGPEYETVGVFGSQLECDDLNAIAYANWLCNDLGLDTISTGGVIGLVYALEDQGRLDREAFEIDEWLRFEWGELEGAFDLIASIAIRKGFGDLLADGILPAATRLKADDLAAHVNGLDIPMHDPRAFLGLAIAYLTNPRGACHLMPDVYMMDMGVEVEPFGVVSSDRHDEDGKAEMVARFQDYRTVYNAAVMCHFASVGPENLIGLLNAATGFGYDFEGLQRVGERIFVLKRLINLNLGYTTDGERLPPLLMQPLAGGTDEKVPDIARQRSEYYAYRDWDPETGRPSEAALAALGLPPGA